MDEFAETQPLFEALEAREDLAQATFAGGCFWCNEGFFQEMEGVEEVLVGYVGGEEPSPTYNEVVSHETGHREGFRIYFDASVISYRELVDAFWKNIDPTDDGGQFTDRGFNYTTAIFYHDEEQLKEAEASKQALEDSGRFDEPIVTEILPLTSFYIAEDFHQDFYLHSAERYQQFKEGSGRTDFFKD